jgi:rRNA biogenesis protein RRP5
MDDEKASNNDVLEDSEASDDGTGVFLKRTLQGLSVSGFDWSGGALDEDTKARQSEAEGEAPKKKKRRKAGITVDRTGDLDANGPQSIADFERLLMGQPGSSILWLQYMAFQLQLNEVDKAREIAERAIRTIGHQTGKTDSEAMNVWIALLNLENTYGGDETIEEAFKRACEYNDAEEMHSRLASIYIQSGKKDVSLYFPHHFSSP